MLNMTIDTAKASFFRPERIQNAADRAAKRVLSRFGAYVRQRARHSIRKRKSVSTPGSPPNSHVGTLRDLILFAYDRPAKSVVIGPVLFRPASKVPNILEYGGTGTKRDDKGKTVAINIRARPFMRPAFETELSNLPDNWRDSIR